MIYKFIKKENLAHVFSYEFCQSCKNTFPAEHHQTTASDYSSINIVKGELTNETKDCGTKPKL